MGCCLTTTTKKLPSSSFSSNQQQPSRSDFSSSSTAVVNASTAAIESRGPPPSAMEEETVVKEVLSETAVKPKPSLPFSHHEPVRKTHDPDFEVKIEVEAEDDKCQKKLVDSNNDEIEVSEISEICSLSETFSATTTITDKMDDYEEVRQRINRSPAKGPRNRSFSGDLGQKRERSVAQSPVRRTDQSPGRRNGVSGQGIVRRGLRSEPHKRDPGENSGRRSRSPAVTRPESGAATRSPIGRSPSMRRSGKSPSRAVVAPLQSTQKEMAGPHSSGVGKWPTNNNESLENPLVSLECFIFL